MKSILIAILLSCLCASGATITASSNGSTDVQTAIDSSSNGDTVQIPSGTVHWSAGVNYNNKGIKVDGQGVTIINDATVSLFTIGANNSTNPYIKNIHFQSGTGNLRFINLLGDVSVKNILISDCTFMANNNDLAEFIKVQRNGVVMWNCSFVPSTDLVNDSCGSGVFHILGDNTSTATNMTIFRTNTMGMMDLSGTNNIYVEDCHFTNMINQAIDNDELGKLVLRYSDMRDSCETTHGIETSTWGGRHHEFYNNTFKFSSSTIYSVNRWMWFRAGSGIICSNVIDDINNVTWGDKAEIQVSTFNCQKNGGSHPCVQLVDYPFVQMVTAGWSNNAVIIEGLWIFNNSGSGDMTVHYCDWVGCGGGSDICGHGLQTSDFVKYGRELTNSAAPPSWWQPFTYPHPDRNAWAGGGGGGGGGSSSGGPGRQRKNAAATFIRK